MNSLRQRCIGLDRLFVLIEQIVTSRAVNREEIYQAGQSIVT
jgi:hypothetical protein